jgi:AraC-like DNA-binding protein
VRSKLIERLPDGNIGEEEIASALNLSLRSLQRKLKAQDVSFKQLLDDTRRDLGLQYVRNPHHSLIEIAFLLGFAEPGNFTRAFKRWYGMSPSKYRQQLLAVG